MTELIKIIILSIVQGVTELLPISSSGHLLVFSKLLDFQLDLRFMTLLHLATGLAILISYWKKIWEILLTKNKISLWSKFVVAVIPAVVAGVLIEDIVDKKFGSMLMVAIELIIWGVVMVVTDLNYEKFSRKITEISKVGWKNSLIIGFSQLLALFPGTSRSGITTLSGIYTGLDKQTAIDFSFIIGLPLVMGSFFYEFLKHPGDVKAVLSTNYIIGAVIAFLTSYAAVELLRKISNKKFLLGFGVYRIVIGIAVIIGFVIL